ncbi:MAG: hypothetical protein LC658_16375, partial [Bacteroidales bacterium]|nr:hypothetical protein [Bacteroidales bacterium]
ARKDTVVTAKPVDGLFYTANSTFGSGQEIESGQFVVYDGTSNGSWLYGLEPSSTYHLAVFEYNGSNGKVFLKTSATGSQLTPAGPTEPSKTFSFSNFDGDRFYYYFTQGNGARRVIIARKDSAVTAVPENGETYLANTTFGSGEEIEPDQFVVYNNSGNGSWIYGLDHSSTYHLAVFEYNQADTSTFYLTDSFLAGSASTISAPDQGPSNVAFSNITGTNMTVGWTRGNGSGRMLIGRAGDPVNVVPEDLTGYSSNNYFGNGTHLGDGNYILYIGTATNRTIYSLQPNQTYHFAVFEYNGSNGRVFLKDSVASIYYQTDNYLQASQATLVTPTIQSRNAFLSSRSNNSLNISWTKGDGLYRLLIGRKDGPVNVEPEDLKSYTTSSGFGSSWAQIGIGNYGLYAGTGNNVNVTNLEPGTNYYFALYEFNGSNAKLYLRPGYHFALETFGERPLVQVSNAQFSNIDFTAFDVGFSKGDGTRRLVLAREGSQVIGGPADYTSYTASNVFGQGDEIGAGNFVVYNEIGENFSLTGLESGKTYYFAFFEYTVSDQGELYKSPSYTSSQATKSLVDLSLTGILAPESGCGLTDNETVTIEVSNLSSTSAPSFQVAYVVNNGEPVV